MTEIAVVGAGLMGHALALVFALGGHQVRLTDTSAETLERAPGLMATALATLTEAGEVDASWDRQRLSHAVRCIPSLAQTVQGAAVVIEAIVERPDAKRAVYQQLETLMEPDGDPGEQHQQPRYLPAGASRFAKAHDHRALVHAALSVRPGRSVSRAADRSGRDHYRARHGARDGQGASGVQADGARLRRQPAAGGNAA